MVHILLSNRPGLRNLDRDTQEMDAVVMKASALAESVRSKVHVLDLAKVTRTPPPGHFLHTNHVPVMYLYKTTHTHVHTRAHTHLCTHN